MLVAHCKALEAHGPIASLNAGPPGPAELLLALEGRASTAVAQRLPGSAPTTLSKKRQSVRPWLFSKHPGVTVAAITSSPSPSLRSFLTCRMITASHTVADNELRRGGYEGCPLGVDTLTMDPEVQEGM